MMDQQTECVQPDSLVEVPLPAWPEGKEATVLSFFGNSPLSSRLRELGVIPGALVRVLRGGCPIVIQVEEGRFCLRKTDADAILVGPVLPTADE